MWLAVDAAGPGIRAWPVGDDGAVGAPLAVKELGALPGGIPQVVDGATAARAVAPPVGIDELRAAPGVAQALLPRLGGGEGAPAAGSARLVGALELAGWRDAPARGRLVCLCREDGHVAWGYAREGQVERLSFAATGRTLADLLRRVAAGDAGDEDDDVAFERGLGIAEDAKDQAGDIDRVLGEAASGRLRRGAVGANLAGVLVGHDAVRGLCLGRLGAPALLTGTGLLADRYAVALGRFGIAVRRIDPVRALVAGCGALGRPRIPIA